MAPGRYNKPIYRNTFFTHDISRDIAILRKNYLFRGIFLFIISYFVPEPGEDPPDLFT
jgi:hypothetical protein